MRLTITYFILMVFISCSEMKQSSLDSNTINPNKSVKLEIPDFEKSSEMIEESKYWEIINKSFLELDKYSYQRSAIINELMNLTPKEIVGFNLRTSKLLKDSYSSELWCAAYIMKGGCSDDGFEYFRCWLISKGKEVFYKAIKDPDSLSELKKKYFFDYELEEFLYLPNEAFLKKTGKEIYDFIDNDEFCKKEGKYPQIVFNWTEENKDSRKKICPKLFKKY